MGPAVALQADAGRREPSLRAWRMRSIPDTIMTTSISVEQLERFVSAWYLALDQHVPVEECYRLVASDGLHMRFPDGDIHDFASFKRWYDGVTHRFFDEQHHVQDVAFRIQGDAAEVNVTVGWQASWFDPPAAKSNRLSLDATQRWTVRRSDRNAHGLEIVTYEATVEPFRYAPGFARL